MTIIHRSSGDFEPREIHSHRSFRRPLLLAAKWIAVVIIFPILLGAAVFAFLVTSARGHAYLINLVQKKAGESLGVPVLKKIAQVKPERGDQDARRRGEQRQREVDQAEASFFFFPNTAP